MGNDHPHAASYEPGIGVPTPLELNPDALQAQLGIAELDSRAFYGHASAVYSCAFSSTGLRLASASRDRTVKIWDYRGVDLMTLKGHNGFALSCDFSPDDRFVLSASDDKTCKMWDLTTGQKIHTFKGHADKLYCCRFNHRGDHFATASCDKTVRLWDPRTHRCISKGAQHASAVFSVDFHPGDFFLASASDDKTIPVWDTRMLARSPMNTLSGHTGTVWSCEFSPNGAQLASASMDGTIRLWEAPTSDSQQQSSPHRVFRGHSSPVHQVTFAYNGRCLVSASRDRTVRVWSTDRGVCLRTLPGHANTVYGVATRNNLVASASSDDSLRLWNIPFEKLLTSPPPQRAPSSPTPPVRVTMTPAVTRHLQQRQQRPNYVNSLAARQRALSDLLRRWREEGGVAVNGMDLADRLHLHTLMMALSSEVYQDDPELQESRVQGESPQNLPSQDEGETQLDPEVVAEIALDVGVCVLCYDHPPDTTLLPCRHMCLCGDCARAWKPATHHTNCPICRQPIDRVVYDTRAKETWA